MPAPTLELLNRLGITVQPFERNPSKRTITIGEADLFDNDIFDATNGGFPPNCIKTPTENIVAQGSAGRYLWVVDSVGLKVILEATPNLKRAGKHIVCHTNITGGKPALHGGELWFGVDNRVYINNASGRYGNADPEQWEAVLAYFTFVGYEVVPLPFLFS